MSSLVETAQTLLADGEVQVVIGYLRNRQGKIRPHFFLKPEQLNGIAWSEEPLYNLAAYLSKAEVRRLGKPALVAGVVGQRSVLQLAAERQVGEGDLLIIVPDSHGGAEVIRSLSELEKKVADQDRTPAEADRILLERIQAMDASERWRFWNDHFSRCLKCYACRAACPMCYCARCTVEQNQPQWIPVAAHPLGNLEWHVMRAMHLAGRCIACGECGRACPVGIPVHLLSFSLNEVIATAYGVQAGTGSQVQNVLATFTPGDREDFIR